MVGVQQIPVSLTGLFFTRTQSWGVGDGVTVIQEPGAVNASESVERERGTWGCYLYPVFWQLRFHGQHLPGIDIWVVGLVECLLQLL